jgi:glycosyltransferase involved in cell wall biosynthesis
VGSVAERSAAQAASGAGGERVTVLHVRIVADRGGGPEKTILLMDELFRGSRYRPVAAYLHPPASPGFAELAAAARTAGCEMRGLADRGPFDPRPLLSLLRLCRDLDVAIWHAHDYKSAAFGVLLRRLHAMRMVTTIHGWADLSLRTRLYFAIDRLCLRAFDHVFAVSPDLAASARRCGVAPARVSLLYNGVDDTRFRRHGPPAGAALRRELGVPAGRHVIATVSRLAAAKGLEVALDAFSRLVAAGVDAELWITGDGPEREPLRKRASALSIASRVRFLGHRADVRPVLEASDLLLSASWREGTPNSVLEALAMEVAVVATAAGGVGELVRDGDSGRLCAAGDAAALAAAMRQLLGDGDLRARLGRAGRRLVQSEYSLAERTRREIEVYDRLLAGEAS